MAATIEILTGAARLGKTARLLAEYRTELQAARRAGRWGTTLWLAPTVRARREIADRLVDESLPVCFSPNVLTFDAFADVILDASNQNATEVTDVARRTLLRSIVARLADDGALKYFSPIVETSGFLNIVGVFISELKRDEIWPDQFSKACRARGRHRQDAELALIYEQYQDQLVKLQLYDAEGRFWSARTALNEGTLGRFGQLSLVVADGFTDFTHTQHEILARLAHLSQRLLISLPVETPLVRADLFAKSDKARCQLEAMADESIAVVTRPHILREGEAPAEPDCDSASTFVTTLDTQFPSPLEGEGQGGGSEQPSIRLDQQTPKLRATFDHIADRLFDNPRNVAKRSDASGIEVVAATGQLGEVEMLAEKVKRLLLTGTRPDEIVIAFRTLDDYADLIHEVFSAAGIPYWCEAGTPLSRMPIVKALFAVLQLEEEGWPFDRLMEVLDSSYFQPHWNDCHDQQAIRAAAAALRSSKARANRTTILRVLERAKRHDRPERNPMQDPLPPSGGGLGWGGEQSKTTNSAIASDQRLALTDSERAFELVQKLSAATDALRSKRTLSSWVAVLEKLSSELGFTPPSDKGDDAAAWGLFWKALREAVTMTSTCDENPRQFDVAGFVALLKELILPETLPPTRDEQGRVRIVQAAQVRAMDVPHLFLAGLTEGSFPRIADDDFLYNDAERHDLNALGLSLAQRSSRTQDEMLLFYGVVTRARSRLVLSYPAISARGQSLFPSPYVAAVRELFTESALPITQVGELDPVPARDRIQTAADLRLVATNELHAGQPGLFRGMAEAPDHQAAAINILAAFDMAANRFNTRGFTPHEGLVQSPANLERLRVKFPDDYQFSATQLENYAGCPFRFFVSEILRIKPLESPRTETDYLGRGSALHSVLAQLHRKLSDDADAAPATGNDSIASRFRTLVSQELGRNPAETELQKALLRIEERVLSEWADAYEGQHDSYLKSFTGHWEVAPTPTGLEVGFGTAPGETGELGAQNFGSLALGSGDKQVRIRGRIDRVDNGSADGQSVFNIIDYKLGIPPRFTLDDIRLGRSLQLALYTLAAYRLGIAAPGAVPFHMGYWSPRETGFVSGLKGKTKSIDAAILTSLEAILDELVPKLVETLRDGQFPVDSRDAKCTGLCVYSTICRVNEVRPLADKLNKRRSD